VRLPRGRPLATPTLRPRFLRVSDLSSTWSKEGLLDAIFESAWRQLNVEVATLLAAAESPAAGIRTLMRFMLKRLDDQPALKRLMLFEGRRVRAQGLAVTAGFRQFVDRPDALLRLRASAAS